MSRRPSCTCMTTRRAARATATGASGTASLRLFTLLQFLPGAWWTTRTGVERNVYPEFPPPAESPAAPQPASGLSGKDWEGATELAAPEVHELLGELSGRNAPVPEVALRARRSPRSGARRGRARLAGPQGRGAARQSAGGRWCVRDGGLADIHDGRRRPRRGARQRACGWHGTDGERGSALMAARTKMAMSSDFLDAFAKLPRPQQRSVRTLISRFNADSTAKGLNYEKIPRRPRFGDAIARIDQGYRAIVLKPEQGDVHMLSGRTSTTPPMPGPDGTSAASTRDRRPAVYEPSTEPTPRPRPRRPGRRPALPLDTGLRRAARSGAGPARGSSRDARGGAHGTGRR